MFSFNYVQVELKHRHTSDDIENFVRRFKQVCRDLISVCDITGTADIDTHTVTV